jgi:hypothetical protein
MCDGISDGSARITQEGGAVKATATGKSDRVRAGGNVPKDGPVPRRPDPANN